MKSEGAPIEGITGIEHFGYWLADYHTGLLSDPQIPVVSKLPREIKIDIRRKDSGSLFLINCPWDSVPESIQAVLKLQYEAADLLEKKQVHVFVHPSEMLLQLDAPLIKRGKSYQVDILGENTGWGLFLYIADDPLVNQGWGTIKTPLGKDPVDMLIHRMTQQMMDSRPWKKSHVNFYPAAINELQDLARFLKGSRHKAVVVRIDPQRSSSA